MSPRLSDLFLNSQSDERLVSLARAGHDRAFASIVQRYRPELLALARQLRSDGHAEDLLQQAFLSAFAALRSGAEVHHLRGWLYQIVRNAATKANPPADLALDQVDIAGEPLEETVLRRAAARAAMSELARLPERQRGALVATALGNRPHADVAVSMGVSEQAVRQLVHRARVTLRGAVTGITPWPVLRWLATASNAASAPDVAVSAASGSSGGALVKLGALFAASGALATGVAIGPPAHLHRRELGHARATHALGARSGTVAEAVRSGSLVATPQLRLTEQGPEIRSAGTALETKGQIASRGISRGGRLVAVATANLGNAIGASTPDRQGTAGAGPQRGQGPPESARPPGSASPERSAPGGEDGQTAGGSSRPAGGDSGGSAPGVPESTNTTPGDSGGGMLSGNHDTASTSDGDPGSTPVGSTASASGSSGPSGESDGRSSSSSTDGTGNGSGSGAMLSSSDSSRDGN